MRISSQLKELRLVLRSLSLFKHEYEVLGLVASSHSHVSSDHAIDFYLYKALRGLTFMNVNMHSAIIG